MKFKSKLISILFSLSLITISNLNVYASDYVPYDVKRVPYYNAYRGEYYLNEYENDKSGTGKFKQSRYVDHIDVRTDGYTKFTVNYLENGVLVDSKVQNAIVTNVKDILVNGNDYLVINGQTRDFVSTAVTRVDGVVGKAEYNFQIVQHGKKGPDGYIPKENHNFKFKEYWLDLYTVQSITIVASITVYNDNGTTTDYDNVHITISGLQDIVQKSHCSNGSGLDYYLEGNISNNTIVELPAPPEPEPPVIELPEVTLVPEVGDYFIIPHILLSSLGILLIKINKK